MADSWEVPDEYSDEFAETASEFAETASFVSGPDELSGYQIAQLHEMARCRVARFLAEEEEMRILRSTDPFGYTEALRNHDHAAPVRTPYPYDAFIGGMGVRLKPDPHAYLSRIVEQILEINGIEA